MIKPHLCPLLLGVCAVLACPLSLPAQTAAEKQQAATLVFHANKLLGEKKYDDALDKMLKAVKLVPRNDGYQAYAAKLAALAGKHEDSLRFAREAVKLNPKTVSHHVLVMRAAFETRQYDLAKATAGKVVGFGASRAGESAFKEARSILARADALIVEQYLTAANNFRSEKKYAEALAKVNDALALVPKNQALTEARTGLEPLVDQAEIDRYALQATPEVEQTIQTLAEYLIKPARDDHAKARAIYRWLTDRVAYDTEGFFSGNKGDCSAEAVLKRRTSVCSGYAALFEKLSEQAGLNAVTVRGYAKGYSYKRGDGVAKSDHAWNAVKLKGQWHLLDATWSAGFITDTKQFKKQFRDHYFLMPAEQMIFTHFPDDPQWQLLKPAVDEAVFQRWAKPSVTLFGMGITGKDARSLMEKTPTAEFVEAFHLSGCQLQIQEAPLQRKLHAGTKHVFRIAAPGVEAMSFWNGDRWQALTRKGTVFEGEAAPRAGFFKVMGKANPSDQQFMTILKYDVE